MRQIRDHKYYQEISLVLCGEAGQGIQTIESILTTVLSRAGYYVFATQEFMSRIRGGLNSTEIRVSSKQIACFVDRIDILIPLATGAIEHLEQRISRNTLIIGEQKIIGTGHNRVAVEISAEAKKLGNKLLANTFTAGLIGGLLSIDSEFITDTVAKRFKDKDETLIQQNIDAVRKGLSRGQKIHKELNVAFKIPFNPDITDNIVINGTNAVALGAAIAGCNFIAAYPMSPSTGVFTFLANYSRILGIVVEQVEDEISAINMAIGAWYAGARALVTTSGGGFALMGESVSLAGILETPVLIHLAQRPGPATGLPTRTEQGDLELALYAGHGEFPRILYAPVSVQSAINIMQLAFRECDYYQIPVIVLTDQYFLDSSVSVQNLVFPEKTFPLHIIETTGTYQRYQLTDDGISPRGIPGLGTGLVCVDSDEHDERGQISENPDIRKKMMQKRLKKLDKMKESALEPLFFGSHDYETLVICWGSNYNTVCEAVTEQDRSDIAILCFEQLYPISSKANDFLKQAKKTICFENNATGQFAKLLKRTLDFSVDEVVLKYDGSPFSVEEITKHLQDLIA